MPSMTDEPTSAPDTTGTTDTTGAPGTASPFGLTRADLQEGPTDSALNALDDVQDDQDDVLNEGGMKALRAERSARKDAERQLKASQHALQDAQEALQASRRELFDLRFEQAAAPLCAYPELLRKLGDWDDTMSADEIREQATKIVTQYPKLANEPVNRDRFTLCAKAGPTNHTINANMFADAVRDALGR